MTVQSERVAGGGGGGNNSKCQGPWLPSTLRAPKTQEAPYGRLGSCKAKIAACSVVPADVGERVGGLWVYTQHCSCMGPRYTLLKSECPQRVKRPHMGG